MTTSVQNGRGSTPHVFHGEVQNVSVNIVVECRSGHGHALLITDIWNMKYGIFGKPVDYTTGRTARVQIAVALKGCVRCGGCFYRVGGCDHRESNQTIFQVMLNRSKSEIFGTHHDD